MSLIIRAGVDLETIECWVCGLNFAASSTWLRKRRELGEAFQCPAGCRIRFGPSELDRLGDQLARARARETHERDQRQAAERSNIALRGVITKTRKRIGKGACPCCNRHFANVERHMASQHPDYAASTP